MIKQDTESTPEERAEFEMFMEGFNYRGREDLAIGFVFGVLAVALVEILGRFV